MNLIEQGRGRPGAFLPFAFSGHSQNIKIGICEAGFIQPLQLCYYVLCRIAFVHKSQSLVIAIFSANIQMAQTKSGKFRQLVITFFRYVIDSALQAYAVKIRVLPSQNINILLQFPVWKDERISSCQVYWRSGRIKRFLRYRRLSAYN